MRYDFIEIGSCDFETLLQSCKEGEKGITIEPIRKYLDNLPDKHNVKKICAAMVGEFTEDINVYFVDEDEYGNDLVYNPGEKLPRYLKGCNSVAKPHDYHLACPEDLLVAQRHGRDYADKMKTYNLLDAGFVKVESCRCITFSDLVRDHNITYVSKIKLDTEGQDCILLSSILDFYEKSKMNYPNVIQFETNMHNDPTGVDLMCERLAKLDYKIKGWDGKNYERNLHDCIAVLDCSSKTDRKILDVRQIKRIEELKQIHRMHDGWEGMHSYVGGLIDLIGKYLSSDSVICEIGSYRGVSTEVFAIFCKKVFCIDIWDGLRNEGDDHPLSPENEFDIMCSNYENIIKIKETSKEASNKFDERSLDAIYIDADHSFEGFTQDMNYWIPKVRKNGYVMGHDWTIVSEWSKKWVDPSYVEIFSDDSWIFKNTKEIG